MAGNLKIKEKALKITKKLGKDALE